MKKDIVSAAFLIIGDEVLSGRTIDKNLNFLAVNLTEMGIDLQEVRVVKDIEADIIFALNEIRKKYDYVFTSGGIGPTHDDITSLSVAKAFGVELIKHNKAVEILIAHYGDNINEARLKMAYIPSSAALLDNPVSSAPGFRIENVFVMAGVPKIFQAMFYAAQKELIGGKKIFSKEIKISLTESIVAKVFGELQMKYPQVIMGSYPFDGGTSLVFRSREENLLNKAKEEMENQLLKIKDNLVV